MVSKNPLFMAKKVQGFRDIFCSQTPQIQTQHEIDSIKHL